MACYAGRMARRSTGQPVRARVWCAGRVGSVWPTALVEALALSQRRLGCLSLVCDYASPGLAVCPALVDLHESAHLSIRVVPPYSAGPILKNLAVDRAQNHFSKSTFTAPNGQEQV